MKLDVNVCNSLKSVRTRLGMSQQELANLAGVTRQTIGGVESGQYAPSVAVTLRLAKALGCQVENLFWLEEDLPEVEAVLAKPVPTGEDMPVSIARVGSQWVAYPLIGNDAFRLEMIPADGKAQVKANTNKVKVQLLDDISKIHNTVVIAGCAPVISFLARATERWHPQLRVHHYYANSMAALRSLCGGQVHIAGMHLYDPVSGEHNTPFVREALKGKSAVLITLGVWEEGILVQSGNPMGIKNVTDLVELGAKIINREAGSGCRMLLERELEAEHVPLHMLKGFEHVAHSHQNVALSVVSGIADAGISTSSVAAAFGLGFIPLHQARYDLVVLKEYLEDEPVQQFLSTLGHRLVQSQLEILGGYDISNIGEVVANVCEDV